MSKLILLLILLVVVVFVTAREANRGGKQNKSNPKKKNDNKNNHPHHNKPQHNNGHAKPGGSGKKQPPKAAHDKPHHASPVHGHTPASTQGGKVIKKQLRGVNRSGTEFACVGGYAIFDGPSDDKSIESMKKWNINVVRVPLNADCWLGVNGLKPEYSGEKYRSAIIDYVHRLRHHDLSVIVDLHWTNGRFTGAGCICLEEGAKCQKPMPDKKHAVDFWKSVAKEFGKDENIIFDLFNEPYPDMVYWDKKACWNCWKHGGDACKEFSYPVAGMEELVSAVRSEKAINPLMVGGINWSSDLRMWKEHVPKDPLKKIVASWHAYALNPCNKTECWSEMIEPIAKEYSVIVGEIGEVDCGHSYIDSLMEWLDKHDISYLAWTWNNWKCRDGPSLITDYDGTPSKYGEGFKNHLNKK